MMGFSGFGRFAVVDAFLFSHGGRGHPEGLLQFTNHIIMYVTYNFFT